MRPVCLIVRDGWGCNPDPRGNAAFAALTPNIDRYLHRYPSTLLDASGEAVGLPAEYQGSSEVGHLNMGAGRVVVQELKRIDDAFRDGTLFKEGKWRNLMQRWAGGGKLHFLGLLQDEGVHAHCEQLFALARQARRENATGVIVFHPFLDGRDTPPRSCLEYLGKLEKLMAELGNCVIGTVMGRYYAMDRSANWGLTDQAFRTIVGAEGAKTGSARAAVEESYGRDRTPDGVEMFDEYIPPHVVGDYAGVSPGDCVFHTNYRQDRAIQLTRAFIDPAYPGKLPAKPEVTYLGFTRYYDEFNEYLMGPMGGGGAMNNLLGEVIAAAGLRQLRIAETQKYRHVTSFCNGKATTPYRGEDDVEINGRFDASSFASHPEMEAYRVTEELLKRLESNPYAFIMVNFANGDMVGHTGNLAAATRALAIVDECVGRVVERMLELDGQVLITADHGNAEQMIDYETGMVKTSHTMFPVECVYVAKDAPGRKLRPRGKLADIAPTVLQLLGLKPPADMTAQALIE